MQFAKNTFKVGVTVGGKVAVLEALPERMTPADAVNLAAWLVALSLGSPTPPMNINQFLEGVAELVEGSLLAEQIKAELG